jgi:hypothetical protein
MYRRGEDGSDPRTITHDATRPRGATPLDEEFSLRDFALPMVGLEGCEGLINVIVAGVLGAGKSSFINSVASVVNGLAQPNAGLREVEVHYLDKEKMGLVDTISDPHRGSMAQNFAANYIEYLRVVKQRQPRDARGLFVPTICWACSPAQDFLPFKPEEQGKPEIETRKERLKELQELIYYNFRFLGTEKKIYKR